MDRIDRFLEDYNLSPFVQRPVLTYSPVHAVVHRNGMPCQPPYDRFSGFNTGILREFLKMEFTYEDEKIIGLGALVAVFKPTEGSAIALATPLTHGIGRITPLHPELN